MTNQKPKITSKVDKAKFISAITNKMEAVLTELQLLKPKKEFTLTTYKPNAYWSFHWKSTKLWKTEHYLKEWFSVSLYQVKETVSLNGEHHIKDIFEQLEDRHFLYEEKTIEELFRIVDIIEKQTKEAVLKAVDQEFDSSY